MARNRIEETPQGEMPPEEWQALNDQLWKDFRSSSEHWDSSSHDERATRAQTALAIAAIQPYKPKS